MSERVHLTEELPFFACNAKRDHLFAVREGVPVINALEQASCFLDCASTIASHAGQTNDGSFMFAAYYLINLAKAAIDATTEGTLNHE